MNEQNSKISIQHLNAWFGPKQVIKNISLEIKPFQVVAVIGPSGCGKSTLVRCINRMHEVVIGARVEGKILVDGEDIYQSNVDPVLVRRKVGMVFQRPNPFPTLSIFDNVIAGLKLGGGLDKQKANETVEKCLRMAALWDEVKDSLHRTGTFLSGGQQQRLCIARALAVSPEVLLMDEPCSALDPISTAKIEQLLEDLKKDYTIVIVTHNMQQAARVSDKTAFLLSGELIEYNDTPTIFKTPSNQLTEDYITGRFG
ncbi:MAG: phosphate ABC transporter ATP-binding protein [Deltaproteobacteria bacterium]|nr:phosphate ABC transporter ATP-binding protein [Deltaproteobacteria bacterium]